LEVSVQQLLDADGQAEAINQVVTEANDLLNSSETVVIFSADLVIRADSASSLAIGNRVSDSLVSIVCGITAPLRYLVAKGGITSSDVATRGLGVRRALVMGQIVPGVLSGNLAMNVSDRDLSISFSEVMSAETTCWRRSSNKLNQEHNNAGFNRRYPCGGTARRLCCRGFNIYNLRSQSRCRCCEQLSLCVVTSSSAAVDIGGLPLIDLCMSYARRAHVPVGVHLDHSSSGL
jgi:hypothetical protein